MFEAMADAEAVEIHNGNFEVTRNGQTLVLHRPRGKDLADMEELKQVRHFLERSGTSEPPSATVGTHLLVVIDHREARIYNTELHGSVPQRITPYDPYGFGRHLHYDHEDANGQRTPERKASTKLSRRRCIVRNRSWCSAPVRDLASHADGSVACRLEEPPS